MMSERAPKSRSDAFDERSKHGWHVTVLASRLLGKLVITKSYMTGAVQRVRPVSNSSSMLRELYPGGLQRILLPLEISPRHQEAFIDHGTALSVRQG
jgi:hypothetical protein